MNNKNSNTTTRNICDGKNDNKAHHKHSFYTSDNDNDSDNN